MGLEKKQLTGPNALESQLRAALSPSTQQCPSGILVTLGYPGSCTHSPGSAINLFTNNSLWLLGHLQTTQGTIRLDSRDMEQASSFNLLAEFPQTYLNKITSPCENSYFSRHLFSAKTKSPGSNTLVSTNGRRTTWIGNNDPTFDASLICTNWNHNTLQDIVCCCERRMHRFTGHRDESHKTIGNGDAK